MRNKFYYDDDGYKWIRSIDINKDVDVIIEKIIVSALSLCIGYLVCLFIIVM